MNLLRSNGITKKIIDAVFSKSTPKNLGKNQSNQGTFKMPSNYGRGHVKLRQSDVFLTSYPKSGNTWTRFLIANLIKPDCLISFANINDIVPDIYKTPSQQLNELPNTRIIKSHECFDPRYKKVIYLVRNPYSVSVSFYHHLIKFNKISEETEFRDFLQNFLQGLYMKNMGSWEKNVASWLDNKSHDKEQFLLIKYEDLRLNPFQETKKIQSFLSLDIEDKKVKEAIELSDFKHMQNLEKNQNNEAFFASTNSQKNFVRSADLDEWKRYFDKQSTDLVKVKFGKVMERLGYSTT
ncbi:MAG: sulfotransferase domain-containing protein [Cyanobacteria bacterium P01_G01_bin.49]